MKKIKLFLITLLCMVGVMNVCAQEEFELTVNAANGVMRRTGNTWESNAVFGENGGHVTVDDDAPLDGSWIGWLRGAELTSDGHLRFNVKTPDHVTISVPEGYSITGYDLTVVCNMASVTCGGETKTSGDFHFEADGVQSVTFNITPVGDYGVLDFGSITCTNFVVYFKKRVESGYNFKDADEREDVVSGAMYVLSTEPSKGNDRYFKVNGTSVTAGGAGVWPNLTIQGISSALIDVNSVWEVTLLNDKKVTLKSMATDKYLGDASTNQPVVTKDSKAEAMQFKYDGPYTNGNRILGKTNFFYTLQCQNNSAKDFLSYVGSGTNNLTMVDNVSVNVDWNTRSNQRFRFHRVEYVRIGVFTQQDGVLSPLDYTVSMIVDRRANAQDNLSGKTPIALSYSGQVAICSEHHQGENGVLSEKIQGRIKSISVTSSPEIAGIEPIYIVNGSVVNAIDYEKIKSGYNISIIYELPTAPDPDDPTLPSAAGFYKLQSKFSDNYLNAVKNTDGAVNLEIDANDGEDAIFYYDGSSLLSYTNGVFVKDNKMGEIEEVGSKIQLVTNANSDNEKWDIRLGAQYLTCDNGGNSTTPIFAPKPSQEYILNKVYDLPVKLNEVGGHYYGTFYAPVGVKVPEDSNLEAYVGTVTPAAPGEEYDVLKLKRVTEIPANTGVLLYVENNFADGYTLTIDKKATGNKGNLSGTCERYYVKSKGDNIYGLNKKDGVAGFFKMSPTSKLSAFRAFLQYDKSEGAKGFVFSFSETDVIEALEMSHAEPIIYDLQGRRVQNPGTGIYIVNGKKIMITK